MHKPTALGESGSVLWDLLTSEFELSPGELVLLAEVCHTADELEELRDASECADATVAGSQGQVRVNPLFRELREHRALFVKLLGGLALPADDEVKGLTPSQRQASEAARSRWAMERAKWGRGGKTA